MTDAKGWQQIQDISTEYGVLRFVIRSMLLKMQTAMPVRVLAVSNNGEVAVAGTVDVLPLVQTAQADGTSLEHKPIYGVPYMRVQGGANAIIMDPQVGDVGIAVFCSRDINGVKADPSSPHGEPPSSARAYDWSDAIYLGAVMWGVPSNYVRFPADGSIEVVSPVKITLSAPAIELDGPVTATSTINATGDVVGAGTSLHTHKHGGVTTGGGQTGVPV